MDLIKVFIELLQCICNCMEISGKAESSSRLPCKEMKWVNLCINWNAFVAHICLFLGMESKRIANV